MTDLDRYFPRAGKCAFCAVYDARHRTVDAIKGRHAAGESVKELADDLEMPEAAIRAAIKAKDSDSIYEGR